MASLIFSAFVISIFILSVCMMAYYMQVRSYMMTSLFGSLSLFTAAFIVLTPFLFDGILDAMDSITINI